MPDVLPPIHHPLVAEVLLTAAWLPDADAVTALFAARGIPLGGVPWTRDATGRWRRPTGGTATL